VCPLIVLRTIAVLSKELGTVRLVNKVVIAMLCSTVQLVTINEGNSAEQVYQRGSLADV
jgi:hypothetical protein